VTKDTIVNQCGRNFVVKFIAMKNLVLTLSVFAVVTACNAPEPEVLTLPTTVAVNDSVVANASKELFISGMTCVMGCKGAIEKKLNATNGISDFHIVFEDSTATVRFDSTLITVDKIIAEVADVAVGGFYTATLLDI
jgi:copper chaperone CopZ